MSFVDSVLSITIAQVKVLILELVGTLALENEKNRETHSELEGNE